MSPAKLCGSCVTKTRAVAELEVIGISAILFEGCSRWRDQVEMPVSCNDPYPTNRTPRSPCYRLPFAKSTLHSTPLSTINLYCYSKVNNMWLVQLGVVDQLELTKIERNARRVPIFLSSTWSSAPSQTNHILCPLELQYKSTVPEKIESISWYPANERR